MYEMQRNIIHIILYHVFIVQAVRKLGTTPELHSLRKSITIINNLCELYKYLYVLKLLTLFITAFLKQYNVLEINKDVNKQFY